MTVPRRSILWVIILKLVKGRDSGLKRRSMLAYRTLLLACLGEGPAKTSLKDIVCSPITSSLLGLRQTALCATSHPFDKIDCNNSRRNGTRNTILHEFLAALNTHLLRNVIMFLLGKSFQDPILFSNIFALLSSTPPQRKCEPSLRNTTLSTSKADANKPIPRPPSSPIESQKVS